MTVLVIRLAVLGRFRSLQTEVKTVKSTKTMFYYVVRLSLFCVFEPFIELVISAMFTTQKMNTECFQVIRVIL